MPARIKRISNRRNESVFQYGIYWIGKEDPLGNWYYYFYSEDKKEVKRRTLKTVNLVEAIAKLKAYARKTGTDPETAERDPRVIDAIDRFLQVGKKRISWRSTPKILRPTLEKIIPETKMSQYFKGLQKEIIRGLYERGYAPNTIYGCLGLISAAVNFACKQDDYGNTMSSHRPELLYGITTICEVLNVPEPDPRNYHPEMDEMAAFISEAEGNENLRRFILISLATACRPSAAMELTLRQLNFRYSLLNLNPPKRRQFKNKWRPELPIAEGFFQEMLSWPCLDDSVPFISCSLSKIVGDVQEIRARLNLPEMVPSSIRDFMATQLRDASENYGVHEVPDQQVEKWMGHFIDTTNSRYGKFSPKYLARARVATECVLNDLNERSGNVLYRQTTARAAREVVEVAAKGSTYGFIDDASLRTSPIRACHRRRPATGAWLGNSTRSELVRGTTSSSRSSARR